MKRVAFLTLMFFVFYFCNAQDLGQIIPKQTQPKAGISNFYVYRPPSKLKLPEKISALVVYEYNQQLYNKIIPMINKGKNYEFSFKAPDSTAVLIFGIVDGSIKFPEKDILVLEKKKIVDNNSGKGFVFFLKDMTGNSFEFEKISLANLLNDGALYFLELNSKTNAELIYLYEESFKLYPQLMNYSCYYTYLSILKAVDENKAKSKLIEYIKNQLTGKPDETNLIKARRAYRLLKMNEEKLEIEKRIFSEYPDGEFAKAIFLDNYRQEKKTEQSILATMNTYVTRFKDSSNEVKDQFYRDVLMTLIDNKQWNSLTKYEQLLNNVTKIAYVYDYYAWKLVGKQIDSAATDIELAKLLSSKSLGYSNYLLNKLKIGTEALADMKIGQHGFYETYALIMYKLGKYDSAFYLQLRIIQSGNQLNTGNIERFAAYSEKAKGDLYAKQFIETELSKGVNSQALNEQLQKIYAKLNLSKDELAKVMKEAVNKARLVRENDILEKFGDLRAKEFSLRNIQGELVSLSSFSNKIVVLDFWATWCGPCLASFPDMQLLVNKYKNDSDVVFLFIDVWENKNQEEMTQAAQKIVKDKNYTFNVLLDIKNEVVKDYKIDVIPKKMIIDKKGNLVYTGDTVGIAISEGASPDKLSEIIEKAKK